jgi:hypothetical protein
MFDPGQVFLEHLLLSRHPSVEPTNPESIIVDSVDAKAREFS